MTGRRANPPIPTDTELGILRVLWARGPSTVRDVLEAQPVGRSVGYTTVLKLLQIMYEKGLVERDESSRSHVYRASVEEQATERRLVTDLAERGFAGSTARLVMRALSTKRPTAGELEEISRLIERLEGGEGT